MSDLNELFSTQPPKQPITPPEQAPAAALTAPLDATPVQPQTEDAGWDSQTDTVGVPFHTRVHNHIGGSAYVATTAEELAKLGPAETLIMPPMRRAALVQATSDLDMGSYTTKEDMRHLGMAFANVMEASPEMPEEVSTYFADDIFEETVKQPTSQWTDKVPSPIGNLGIAFPAVPQSGEKLTGRRAVLQVQNTIGRKPYAVVPLWHSGIWFRIRRPVDGDIIDLMEEIASSEIQFGRDTYGHSFSNDLGYTYDTLVNFFIDHIEECSLSVESGKLKDYILTPDISAIAWGLASAIYPRGFRYSQACLTDTSKCRHVIEGLMDLAGMYKTDLVRLTEGQVKHMTNRRSKQMTPESVKAYQESFIHKDSTIITPSGARLTFQLPVISATIAATTGWMQSITNAYPAILEKPVSTRNRLLKKHARSSSLRRYSQYVKEIEIEGGMIETADDIDKSLVEFSGDNQDRLAILEGVKKFIASNTINVVAIESPICPSCKGEQAPLDPKAEWPDLIVIDPVRVFFLLMPQRIQLINQR